MTVPEYCWYSDWHGRNGHRRDFARKRAALLDTPAVAPSTVIRRLKLIILWRATWLRPWLHEV
jgi:hypothetical protein